LCELLVAWESDKVASEMLLLRVLRDLCPVINIKIC
jgi:hypothetical protein